MSRIIPDAEFARAEDEDCDESETPKLEKTEPKPPKLSTDTPNGNC